MKRLIIVFLAVCLSFMTAAPAISADVDFSGDYYVEGIWNSKPNLLDSESRRQHRRMRLRVLTDFTVTDNLKLTTRFDALDKLWNTGDVVTDSTKAGFNDVDATNIDFNRAYMTIKSKVGLFQVGRMQGITWGTTWADDYSDVDRIKYVVPLEVGDGKLYIVAINEKTTENDIDSDLAGKDNDKWYLATVYKKDKFDCGLLFGYYNFNRSPDGGQRYAIDQFDEAGYSLATGGATAYGTLLAGYGAALTADAGVPGANVVAFVTANPGFAAANARLGAPGNAGSPLDIIATRSFLSESDVYLISPYFKGKFNKLGISAELDYIFGNVEYVDGTEKDHDIAAYSWFVEGTYDVGPLVLQAGYAYRTGDSNDGDDEEESMGYVSPGLDWEKMFILSSDSHGMNRSFAGGLGNHVGTRYLTWSQALVDGFQMPYLGIDYTPKDCVTIGLLAAMSTADTTRTGWEDDQGTEVDLNVTWRMMDNLEYRFTAAYLASGDYWKGDPNSVISVYNSNPEDITCLYSKLTLTF